ncbi:hypothetical protein KIS1582_0485 [Cytobacillus firmus]|uniref:Uncharacterized protein n=1 Tax=Cytobacillus firmus TaxID=1399 RepID=A0A800NFV7_CYTFI|nr:hypothetical protein KIS1582_0485 [Cytobacillus firmus]
MRLLLFAFVVFILIVVSVIVIVSIVIIVSVVVIASVIAGEVFAGLAALSLASVFTGIILRLAFSSCGIAGTIIRSRFLISLRLLLVLRFALLLSLAVILDKNTVKLLDCRRLNRSHMIGNLNIHVF